MLIFLRPQRGHRRVWVDSICINQKSLVERSTQVAKMGSIYSNCRRVVVYLGDEIVTNTPSAYPVRRRIEDVVSFDSTTTEDESESRPARINLTPILQRRYFSRIWVVQELLLPPQVAIQV